jgi:hypothetical protein
MYKLDKIKYETMRFRSDANFFFLKLNFKKLKPPPMLVLWVIISFPRKSWQVKVGYMDIWPIVLKN